MVESSWCGLLAGLALTLRLSQAAATTEAVLRAFQSFIRVTGVLGLATPRDAFITAVCTACLPEHYSVAMDPPSKGWQVRTGDPCGPGLVLIASHSPHPTPRAIVRRWRRNTFSASIFY